MSRPRSEPAGPRLILTCPPAHSLELHSDPAGIGFGFGGVEPGTLHAHGQLYEKHNVFYSIGLAGDYLLHVRLRQQAMPVPGSPFKLTVLPAPADAKSTKLPPGPVHGMVGEVGKPGTVQANTTTDDKKEGKGDYSSWKPEIDESKVGASLVMRTRDKMGNFCSAGGANVKIVHLPDRENSHMEVDTKVIDRKDGSYKLEWRSKSSGTFRTRVTISDEDVIGSPLAVSLASSNPDLSKSEMAGEGLRGCVAGVKTSITIRFVDQ